MTRNSIIRINFHEESEQGVNDQINYELHASYLYLSMSYFFGRDDVALPGFRNFFHKNYLEEAEHARKWMDYMNKRGGNIVLQDIKRPSKNDWGSALEALLHALEFEKKVYDILLKLAETAYKHHDEHLSHFVEDHFLEEQVESIQEFSEMITKLQRAGTSGLGTYQFDQDLLKSLE